MTQSVYTLIFSSSRLLEDGRCLPYNFKTGLEKRDHRVDAHGAGGISDFLSSQSLWGRGMGGSGRLRTLVTLRSHGTSASTLSGKLYSR